MSEAHKHDDILFSVLKEGGQIMPFLDAIFGFLYRRTDFYIIQDNSTVKVGFPPGVAEEAVRDVFRKWQTLSSAPAHPNNISLMEADMTDLVIHEEEVMTTDTLPSSTGLTSQQLIVDKPKRDDDVSSGTYNGADCGNYRWSQTALEVDIEVPVPNSVIKSSEVQVDIQACQLTVSMQDATGQWSTLVDGQFAHKHFREESIWTLMPGRQITIHLQKDREKWWDSLLTTEARLDLTKLDVTKHVTELPEEDHMQVEKVMVQEERKRMGLMSTNHQEQLEMLKKAWNMEGSPFRGTPFDPSVLQPPQ